MVEVNQPGSSGSGGSTLSVEDPAGTIDDSNTTFIVMNTPLFIDVNGAIYIEGTGTFVSYIAGVITLSSPVGMGGFIRSFFNS